MFEVIFALVGVWVLMDKLFVLSLRVVQFIGFKQCDNEPHLTL